ncbi:sensor histidine kinase [Halostreptopolyspora alba]|uniref:sensor histidine kinase n=1 Tax=Halostreptopolyspora alba TaxID=2487137 RepID=UPI00269799EB
MIRARALRSDFIDHHGPAWWIAELLSTLLFGWGLVSALAGDPPLWVRAALVGGFVCWVGFVGLAWRFPRPATAALATCALLSAVTVASVGEVALVTACVALGVFASHPTPRVWTIATVAVAVLTLATVTELVAGVYPGTVLATIATVPAVVLIGLNRRQYQVRARQTELLLEETRRAQRERARAAALDERARIAREMHDVLAHSLGALRVHLEVAEARLADQGDTAAALQSVRRSRRLATDGLTEARNAVAALRRDVPALPEAVAELADGHRADHHTEVSVRALGQARPVSSAATVALLDTTREALTNAARHAPGRPVTVTLDHQEDRVRLRVRNAPRRGRCRRAPAPKAGSGSPGCGSASRSSVARWRQGGTRTGDGR